MTGTIYMLLLLLSTTVALLGSATLAAYKLYYVLRYNEKPSKTTLKRIVLCVTIPYALYFLYHWKTLFAHVYADQQTLSALGVCLQAGSLGAILGWSAVLLYRGLYK